MRGNIDGGVGYGSAARLEQLHAHVGVMCLIPLPLHSHSLAPRYRFLETTLLCSHGGFAQSGLSRND
ncbi:hypothetical protein PSPO01_01429 [Paraphaeosphaeria sporulosa]